MTSAVQIVACEVREIVLDGLWSSMAIEGHRRGLC